MLADHRCTQFHTKRQYTGHRPQVHTIPYTERQDIEDNTHYTVAADQGRTLRETEIPVVVTRGQSGSVRKYLI